MDAVDRDLSGFVDMACSVRVLQADIEAGLWSYASEKFAGAMATNYLHRPLMPSRVNCVAPGGAFIYESFAAGDEQYGPPSLAGFLLQPGELLEVVRGQLQIFAFEVI